MKVLVDSGNCVSQNRSGGIQTKIFQFVEYPNSDFEIKLFDKWNDRVEEYDILHVFMASYDEFSIVKYAKSKNIPIVVSAIVPSANRFRLFISRVLNQFIPLRDPHWMQLSVLKMADMVIAETEIEKRFIEKNFKISANKIAVIPNGVAFPRPEIKKGLFAELTGIQGKFILQIGRFDSNKNQLNTIKAVNGTDMQLVLIGGPDKNELQYYEQCKKIAGENVHFLGWVDHKNPLLEAALQDAQVVVLPSYKEIFGNAMFEGGVHGANIVATKVLPIKEWGVEPYVLTVNPSSYVDIRKKLRIAWHKERNMKFSGIIRSDFSWETVIKKHSELYRGVLNDNKKAETTSR